MKIPTTRIFLLSIALLASQIPVAGATPADEKAQEIEKRKAMQSKGGARQPSGPAAAARGGAKPSSPKAAPPQNRAKGPGPIAARPAPKRPAPIASRPTPKKPGPNAARPNVARPNVARPNVARPNVARPNAARPNAARPNAARPNAARPNAAKPAPKAGGPVAARPAPKRPAPVASRPTPKKPGPNAARPNAARPNAVRPNAARPNAARPNAARPNAARPNAAKSTPKPGGPVAARSAPKAPAPGIKRPTPKKPGPNAAGPNAAGPNAAGPIAAKPTPKAAGLAAARPAPKGPGPLAKAPASKGPGASGSRSANTGNRPKPNPPALAKARPVSAPKFVAPRGGRGGSFVPGKVTYPNQVASRARGPVAKNPNHPAYYANRAGPQQLSQVLSNSRVSNSRVSNTNTNINTNTSNRTNTNINNNWGNQWTNNSTTVWNNNQTVFNRPVVINPNFQRSVNYAYRPAAWGARPWWSSSTYHSWHQGSWDYGWNRNWHTYHAYRPYYRPSVDYFPGYRSYGSSYNSGLSWGLAAWSLGSLYYDTGYNTYRNPYVAPPIQTGTTVITYSQPISVVASRLEPESEELALTAEEMSSAAIERARAEFLNQDYLAALKSTDESISYASGDTALHEFRALCLFALGRYGDSAGVLNPVLASGPGWDWATMSAFYGDGEIYTGQLRKLEAYVAGSPDAADAHFVLGYHYMVAGFIEESYGMFDRVVTLQPADTVAIQLRNLAESSSPNAAGEVPEPEEITGTPEPDTSGIVTVDIDPTEIAAGWNATSGDGKTITLTLADEGNFTWNYEGAADGKVLSGEWSVDEEGRLVLDSTDVQMVADISLDGDILRFILAGSPVGDPGLSFQRL